jgi:hypothetical protein
MRKQSVIFFVVFLVSVAIALTLAWGAGYKNLETDKAATAKIKALDMKFIKGYVVYPGGTKESPTALFFDLKGGCARPCAISKTAMTKEEAGEKKVWGPPLKQDEIIYAIKALEQVYTDNKLAFPPRALIVADTKGQLGGYVYTSAETVQMERDKDGTVVVYPPSIEARLKGN